MFPTLYLKHMNIMSLLTEICCPDKTPVKAPHVLVLSYSVPACDALEALWSPN
jgi:hypothetical protein